MRTAKLLSVGLIIFMSAALSASDNDFQTPDPDLSLLARLSYQNSSIQQRNITKGAAHICMAVYLDGHFHILRTKPEGGSQMQEGKLSHDQLNELRYLLNTDAIRSLNGSRGALVRGNAQSFIAEIPRKKGVQRASITIADDTPSFPKGVENVVQWLVDFEPVNANTVERTEFPDICPRMQVSGFEPVAENMGLIQASSCSSVDKEAR